MLRRFVCSCSGVSLPLRPSPATAKKNVIFLGSPQVYHPLLICSTSLIISPPQSSQSYQMIIIWYDCVILLLQSIYLFGSTACFLSCSLEYFFIGTWHNLRLLRSQPPFYSNWSMPRKPLTPSLMYHLSPSFSLQIYNDMFCWVSVSVIYWVCLFFVSWQALSHSPLLPGIGEGKSSCPPLSLSLHLRTAFLKNSFSHRTEQGRYHLKCIFILYFLLLQMFLLWIYTDNGHFKYTSDHFHCQKCLC
jgi:hypothetical protein